MLINIPGNVPFHIEHKKENNPKLSEFAMHAHRHFELLYFISGEVTYLVEGNTYVPHPGDLFIFNIAEAHKVILNSDTPYERTVIQFDARFLSETGLDSSLFSPFKDRTLGENNILHSEAFADRLWLNCIERLLATPKGDVTGIISYLLPLLCEIKKAKKNETAHEVTDLNSKIVRYVNEHITEPLHPEDIAKTFFISRTALYSLFRKATGSSIHDYINIKRLILAQSLLRLGEKPTRVFEKCGFKDYTTFFRAYKSHFSVSPKKDMK